MKNEKSSQTRGVSGQGKTKISQRDITLLGGSDISMEWKQMDGWNALFNLGSFFPFPLSLSLFSLPFDLFHFLFRFLFL